MHLIFQDEAPALGIVPGPLAFAATSVAAGRPADATSNVVWVAGGGRGESSVLRFGEDGWQRFRVGASGLRAVLALSADEAIVVGEYGFCARVGVHESSSTKYVTGTKECLFSIAASADGSVVIGGENGKLHVLEGDRTVVRATGTTERVAALLDLGGGSLLWAGTSGLFRAAPSGQSERLLSTQHPLTALARAEDGTIAIAGDHGQLHLTRPGAGEKEALEARRIDVGVTSNLDAVVWDAASARFVVGGEHGLLFAISLGGEVTALETLSPPRSVTALLPHAGGLLVGAWHQTGAPYRFRGLIAYVGPAERAPTKVMPPPRQSLPPRRERTVATGVTQFLSATDGKLVPIDDARARVGDVPWPETSLTQARLYEGDVHVASTDELFDSTEKRGYAVVITGSLVVDSVLDAVAGGDGYDSVLVVGGDVWAESAVFRYGIKASIGGTLEIASVILCSHGDDGGTLWFGKLRAQVLAYSSYFPRPDGEIDAFVIGDVYGESDFPPERSAEVFVADALDGDTFHEGAVADLLRASRPALLERSS